MTVYCHINLDVLSREGKAFKWKKPSQCPKCSASSIWGHGYRAVFFVDYKDPLLIKRYRCPNCGCVIIVRPKGYFPRIQTSIKAIYAAILTKLKTAKWPPSISRQRAGHWLSQFIGFIKTHYGHNSADEPPEKILERLFNAGVKFLSKLPRKKTA